MKYFVFDEMPQCLKLSDLGHTFMEPEDFIIQVDKNIKNRASEVKIAAVYWRAKDRLPPRDYAHIFCRESQIKDEVKGVLDFISYTYGIVKLKRDDDTEAQVGIEFKGLKNFLVNWRHGIKPKLLMLKR